MNREELVASAALGVARDCERLGCNCLPDEEVSVLADGIAVVQVLHDPACPAVVLRGAER